MEKVLTSNFTNSLGFERPDWETYFLDLAHSVAQRADCTRRQVGAVLVYNNHVIASGYNGSKSGQLGCATDNACPRGQLTYDQQPKDVGYGNCIAVHAEANAFKQAVRFGHTDLLPQATLYITHKPCVDCEVLIKFWEVGDVRWSN